LGRIKLVDDRSSSPKLQCLLEACLKVNAILTTSVLSDTSRLFPTALQILKEIPQVKLLKAWG